ncbi:hypothetical protein P4639_22050 [Priestia megaterium]|uniref:hypothetical protein n=1 Tax=Priestia megaterium TaxID=1404 RepID=UPI002E22DE20|nr:hypothetical protein [Priestia megaterium]
MANKKIKWRPWVKITFPILATALTVLTVSQAYKVYDDVFASNGKDEVQVATVEKKYPNVLHGVVELSVNGKSNVTILEDLSMEEVTVKAEKTHVQGRVLTLVYNKNGEIEKTYSTSEKNVEKLKKDYPLAFNSIMQKYYHN